MEHITGEELIRTSYRLLHEERHFRLKTQYCNRHHTHGRFVNETMGPAGVIGTRTREHTHE